MLISTFEYQTLFKDKNIDDISEQDIIKQRNKTNETLKLNSDNFTTFKKLNIIADEYGNEKVGITEYTGFEMDN